MKEEEDKEEEEEEGEKKEEEEVKQWATHLKGSDRREGERRMRVRWRVRREREGV